MGTFIVLAVLLLAVGLAVGSMVRDKKNGKSLQCGGDCKYCGGYWEVWLEPLSNRTQRKESPL